MPGTLVLFPHQLVPELPGDPDRVVLVEADRLFTEFDFHVQKLVFHRATMQAYRDALDVPVEYVETGGDPLADAFAAADDGAPLHYIDVVDHALRDRLNPRLAAHDGPVHRHDTPLFLTDLDRFRAFFADRDGYFMEPFYESQRRELDVLMDGDDPVGGRWSFDADNREPLPDNIEIPALPDVADRRVAAARDYVAERFPDAPGRCDRFVYPVTRETARDWLQDFLETRLDRFGPYQDAIAPDEPFLFHSLLSPLLNVGLLTPREVLDATLDHYHEEDPQLRSVEGFVRQLIGWREFVRGVYELAGRDQRDRNALGHDRAMPDAFYTGETGLDPVDAVIDRVQEYAYAHHIERLMVLSNAMLLLRIDPDEVYRWFMELFIDAYDWVMVPNVYGMGQYADGGMMMTKPYVSGSHYLNRMGAFEAGDWEETWDGLYWTFIDDHREMVADNHRMAMMLGTLDRMDEETLEQHRAAFERISDRLWD